MPPTRAEIATGLGFSTASSAEDHLQALARKGALELVPGASRGLRLKDMPGMPVQGTLPLVGRVAAGQPILAAEHVEGAATGSTPTCSRRAPTTCCACAARACGMPASSTAICSPCIAPTEARSGQIVVARLDDEVTVKRWKRRGREIAADGRKPGLSRRSSSIPRSTSLAIEGIGVGLIRGIGGW